VAASLQFASAAGHGVAVQAGNERQQGDASATVLLGEKASQQSAGAFVRASNEAVDPPVFPSKRAMRVSLAIGANALVDDTRAMLLDHGILPP